MCFSFWRCENFANLDATSASLGGTVFKLVTSHHVVQWKVPMQRNMATRAQGMAQRDESHWHCCILRDAYSILRDLCPKSQSEYIL